MKYVKLKLVENWKEAYRWFSMWAFLIAGAMAGAWAVMPADLKAAFPDQWVGVVSVVSFVGALLRLVKQERPSAH